MYNNVARILTGLGFVTFLIYFAMGRDPIWIKYISYAMLISSLILFYIGKSQNKTEQTESK